MSGKTEEEQNRRKPGEAVSISNTNSACDQCRTRKIRCDRKLPCCSNCRKAKLSCDFTNKGKRINHTKQLVEDFSSLSGRLESIDASIAKITHKLDLDNPSRPSSPALSSDVTAPDNDLSHFTKSSSPVGSIEACRSSTTRPGLNGRNNFYISRDQDGAEMYHGPTAGRSLLQQTRIFVNNLLHSTELEDDNPGHDDLHRIKSLISNNPTVQTELRKCNDAFPFSSTYTGFQASHDSRLVSRPPQSFVESSLDFFLEEINTVIPLFDEEHLRGVVKEQYSSAGSSMMDAWNLCFNNIVVLVMGIKLKTASSMNVRRRDLEDDIFRPFLSNSFRAFSCLGEYMTPRLVNVQSLITLALVAADHFPIGVFETLVHRACGVGREMGLERCLEKTSLGPASVAIERRAVFWSLYILDKRRSFLTGKPCDLYLAESDLETPKFVKNDMLARNALARIHMMSIWEEIWKNLYSSRAMRSSAAFRAEQIDRLRSYLKNWVNHHQPVLEKPEQVELNNATCMRLELRYSFHTAQILVHRCLDKPDNLQQQINNARAALKIIRDISQGPPTTSGINLLARLLRTYPILAFYEIHKRTLQATDDESEHDMELMRTCINALTVFHNPAQPEVYFNKLSVGLDWCMRIATILRNVQLEQQNSTPMTKAASAATTIGSPLAKQTTSKRDVDSIESESSPGIDSRSRKRRSTVTDPSTSSGGLTLSSSNTNISQTGSIGPDTPTSGYFSDINSIDPFSMNSTKPTFSTSTLAAPGNDMSEISIPTGQVDPTVLMTSPIQDGKDFLGIPYGFDYQTASGLINPVMAKPIQVASFVPPDANMTSLREPSADLSSLVAQLPPGSQQALTAVPPPVNGLATDSLATFNTPLHDESFTNVGHHPDFSNDYPTNFSNFNFEFSPEQTGFNSLDTVMNMDSMS